MTRFFLDIIRCLHGLKSSNTESFRADRMGTAIARANDSEKNAILPIRNDGIFLHNRQVARKNVQKLYVQAQPTLFYIALIKLKWNVSSKDATFSLIRKHHIAI